MHPKAMDRLEDLNRNGSLAEVFPEVQAMVGFGGGDTGHKDLWGHTKQVVAQTIQFKTLRWAALFHDVGKVKCFSRNADGEISFHGHEVVSARLFMAAAKRTNFFSGDEIDEIRFLIEYLGHVEAYETSWTDSAVRRLYKLVEGHFNDLCALARADITTKNTQKKSKHLLRVKELKDRAYAIAAKDAIPPALPSGLGEVLSKEFGIPPSEKLGDLMKALRERVERSELERQASIEKIVEFVKTEKLV